MGPRGQAAMEIGGVVSRDRVRAVTSERMAGGAGYRGGVAVGVRAGRFSAALVLALGLLLASAGVGCGYRFAVGESGIPAAVGAVYVPVFANRSTEAEAGAIFSEALAENLARRGRLAGSGAPARIEGEVLSIVSEPAATGPDGRGVGVYRLRARLRIGLVDQGQVVCTREFAAGEDYLPAVDLLSLEASRRQAVRRLAARMMAEAGYGLCPGR